MGSAYVLYLYKDVLAKWFWINKLKVDNLQLICVYIFTIKGMVIYLHKKIELPLANSAVY